MSPTAGSAEGTLLERHVELARVEACARSAREGAGAVLVVEGPAGIGKTALLASAREAAQLVGLSFLTARGSEIERDFPYGIVRQLLEPLVARAPTAEREELFAGAAGLAAPVFTFETAHGEREERAQVAALDATSRAFAVLHGLYWLFANLAQREPLLLAIDDAHWADVASLRFLRYLVPRIAELPLGLVVALRSGESARTEELLWPLSGDPLGDVIHPQPLSCDAVAQLLEAALGRPPERRFVEACHAVTGGSPFLLRELLRAVREEGLEPVATGLDRVHALGPKSVARSILMRLRRLAPPAVRLAQATAVLGPGAELRHAATLAEVDLDVAVAAVDTLAGAAILEDARPLSFVHPIVRTAIDRDLGAGERSRLHACAAHLFAAEATSPERVATHLLATEAAGDRWVVDALRAAAADAIAQGAPRSAVTYLRRALAEPPAGEEHTAVLRDLGFAESYAGDPDAARHLDEALARASSVAERVATTLRLGAMLQLTGQTVRAVAVYDRTLRRIAGEDVEAEVKVQSALVSAALFELSTAAVAIRHLPELRRRAEEMASPPSAVFGPLAFAATGANEPAVRVAGLARRALANVARLPPAALDRPPFFYYACTALMWAEAYDEAQPLLDRSLSEAQRLGSLPHFVGLSAIRAWLGQRRGALADAEADARQSLSVGADAPAYSRALALAMLVEVLVERGALDEAEARLADEGMAHGGGTAISVAVLRWSRGRLRLASGRPAEALADLRVAGRDLLAFGFTSPAVVPWRSDAALAHLALGEPGPARYLAEEEIELARAFGAPRTLGCALRAAGLVADGPGDIDRLHEAVGCLASSDAPLEHARALTDLGAALRRRGLRSESRDPLRRGLELAHHCQAPALAERARTELLATGARPRRPALSGVDSLTPSERRVAQMASQGLTNRQIAQALFVTSRTVEGHLTHVFDKLGASGRSELTARLHGDAHGREAGAAPGGEASAP